jgi:hypothetical protein
VETLNRDIGDSGRDKSRSNAASGRGPPLPGILIYTATAGNRGALGGLVEVTHRSARVLASALERERLCSGDPSAPTMLTSGEGVPNARCMPSPAAWRRNSARIERLGERGGSMRPTS